jgi:hypothetical protein
MKKQFERPFIKKYVQVSPGKFGMAVHNEPVTHIDNVPVSELVSDFGSPLFCNLRKEYQGDNSRSAQRIRNTLPEGEVRMVLQNQLPRCHMPHLSFRRLMG